MVFEQKSYRGDSHMRYPEGCEGLLDARRAEHVSMYG